MPRPTCARVRRRTDAIGEVQRQVRSRSTMTRFAGCTAHDVGRAGLRSVNFEKTGPTVDPAGADHAWSLMRPWRRLIERKKGGRFRFSLGLLHFGSTAEASGPAT